MSCLDIAHTFVYITTELYLKHFCGIYHIVPSITTTRVFFSRLAVEGKKPQATQTCLLMKHSYCRLNPRNVEMLSIPQVRAKWALKISLSSLPGTYLSLSPKPLLHVTLSAVRLTPRPVLSSHVGSVCSVSSAGALFSSFFVWLILVSPSRPSSCILPFKIYPRIPFLWTRAMLSWNGLFRCPSSPLLKTMTFLSRGAISY